MYDYFTAKQGYVIDGVAVGSKERALRYLSDVCFMEIHEAADYLSRILKEYSSRVRAAEGVMANG